MAQLETLLIRTSAEEVGEPLHALWCLLPWTASSLASSCPGGLLSAGAPGPSWMRSDTDLVQILAGMLGHGTVAWLVVFEAFHNISSRRLAFSRTQEGR